MASVLLFPVVRRSRLDAGNDTLGPVERDCDGRVSSVSNLTEMLIVAPFPTLIGLA